MDKLPVGQLPDLASSNNDDEIMVITNDEYNQLKKEKISDLITDFTSTNENNALTKGTDGKMFVTDFGNASNITEGTLPVSVLPDIPKDLLPAIETSDLPLSGVTADTYAYPSSVTVNAQGQVTAIEEGTPSGSNANVDLSNITDAGKEVIKENSKSGTGLEIGDIGIAAFGVDETKGLRRYLNGQIVDINTNTQAFLNRLKQITTLHPSLLCTEEEWQTAKTMSAFGQVGKFVFNYSGDEIVSVRIPAIVNVQGLFDLQNLGMTVEAGLPNIEGTVHDTDIIGKPIRTGCFYAVGNNASKEGGGSSSNRTYTGFDASLSNSIYGNSDTVQPEAIQYPYFIQVATGQETEVNIQNQIELNNPYSLFDSKYSEASIFNLSWLLSNGTYYPKSIYTTAYEALLVEYNTGVMQGEAVELPSGGSYIKRGLPVVTMTPGVMTSTHTATSGWSNLENAFDNNSSTYASCGTGTDYIEITFNSPVNVYEFTAVGNFVGAVARACNFAIYSVDEEGEETLLANSTGAAQTTKYTTSASLSGDTVSKLRLYLIAGPTGAPTTQYPTRIIEIKIATAQAQTATDYDFVINTTDETFRLPVKTTKANQEVEGLNLYFYIGETVQNANLIDAGRIGEVLADKVDMLQASGAGMPSNKYIDLTLGASGSTYTAPANGWFLFHMNTSSGKYCQFVNNTTGFVDFANSTSTYGQAITCPARQGETVTLTYNTNNTLLKFQFIYAQGEVA